MERGKGGSLSSSRLPSHCPTLVFLSPPTTSPASLGFIETSVEGREPFNDIQVLKLFYKFDIHRFSILDNDVGYIET